ARKTAVIDGRKTAALLQREDHAVRAAQLVSPRLVSNIQISHLETVRPSRRYRFNGTASHRSTPGDAATENSVASANSAAPFFLYRQEQISNRSAAAKSFVGNSLTEGAGPSPRSITAPLPQQKARSLRSRIAAFRRNAYAPIKRLMDIAGSFALLL